jgi:uncharacterized protein GlcG (DUF336 family)
MSYGAPISLENAKKVAAAALAEVRKNNWTMAVAVVDPAGDLVYFEKMDDTGVGSTIVCQDKARSARGSSGRPRHSMTCSPPAAKGSACCASKVRSRSTAGCRS